jgi:hypothetical protein
LYKKKIKTDNFILSANKENMKIFRKYVDIKVPLSILPQYKNRRD